METVEAQNGEVRIASEIHTHRTLLNGRKSVEAQNGDARIALGIWDHRDVVNDSPYTGIDWSTLGYTGVPRSTPEYVGIH